MTSSTSAGTRRWSAPRKTVAKARKDTSGRCKQSSSWQAAWLDALKPNWDRVSRTRPVARRLNVRVLREQAVREKGSFKKAVEAYPDKGDAEADFRFFEAEANRFKLEFRGQARLTADRMLEESLQAIAKVLTSYGLPPGSARSAARELAAGTGEVDELSEAVIASAKRTSEVDEPAREKHRESLAVTVERLKKHQETIKKLKKDDEELFEQWRKDRAKFDKHSRNAPASSTKISRWRAPRFPANGSRQSVVTLCWPLTGVAGSSKRSISASSTPIPSSAR